ncbi:MAG: twin-arginine translocation signal domain-containing protein [Dehalococcoidia bacterium]|nr:MAG: twin-arginine translocation signal domain-containing protein [Dehalococcoidia bacterium]
MPEEIKDAGGISRRDFLKNTGLLVGGVAAGSLGIISTTGCGQKTIPAVTTSVFVCPICGQEFTSLEEVQAHFISAHPLAGNLTADQLTGLNINGIDYLLQVRPDWTLAFVLRDKLGLFGTKVGCDMGACGACTVLVDGVAMFSCIMLAVECGGMKIQTIEGLSDGIKLSPVQQKFYDNEAFQCGFCTPGFIMAAQGLLAVNAKPGVEDVRQALAGHICTCGNFKKTIEAVAGGI